jgi:hypothetical protein
MYKVIKGIGVWVGKSGEVQFVDGDEVVIRLPSSDDCGHGLYDVRMPLRCLENWEELNVKPVGVA